MKATMEKLIDYCNAHAEAYLLQDSVWYKVEDIAMEMPKGTVTPDNVSAKREFSQRDGEYQYYFRVFEVKTERILLRWAISRNRRARSY